jgi:hypothetical protein
MVYSTISINVCVTFAQFEFWFQQMDLDPNFSKIQIWVNPRVGLVLKNLWVS